MIGYKAYGLLIDDLIINLSHLDGIENLPVPLFFDLIELLEDSGLASKNEKLIKKESHNDIHARLRKFIFSLKKINCENVVIVSHGTYLSQITEYMLDNCELFICNYDDIYNKFIDE